NCALTILYFDLDQFKKVNDELGHEVGDRLLVSVAKRLNSEIGNNIEVARIGGDEFLVVTDETNVGQIDSLINKIMKSIEKTFIINCNEINISVSIGYARYPNDGITRDKLISKADFRMYEVKKKNRILRNPVRIDP